ncbi:copper homeostasis protein CutC [Pelagibacterium lentulum]|uniref:PF03932 family protein CutC n=1 Tax=Pelagibacterium lentulum TaxID=2029865 RepID=A0A916RHS7_9HYPH|nr:copper homeostasis protein CutC [Pelagibacterium lentulum]GGA57167.1 copper homeostasis protein CutC [Pelagibacterium lentulum]
MNGKILEICVDDAAGLEAAIAGGADRIELCSALSVGGLTPSRGFMALAANAPVPVYAMIRPRGGDFIFSQGDIDTMLNDIDAVRQCGLAGVVLGVSRDDSTLDAMTLEKLIDHAEGLGTTLHRAFDLVPDFSEAVETAIALGFERILTSGGKKTVVDGLDSLEKIVSLAAGRISIMPGAGVKVGNAASILKRLGVDEIHSSGGIPNSGAAARTLELGFDTTDRRITDPATVAALKAQVSSVAN